MGLFDLFRAKRDAPPITPPMDDVLLQAILYGTDMNVKKAMQIPAVAACVNLICETVFMIPVKLYREEIENEKPRTIEVLEDVRTALLNDDTKDTFDGVQFKRALVRDYLLHGNSYSYINKKRNKFISVNYVPQNKISVLKNNDNIFKDYNFLIDGQQYKPFEFLKILRSTSDGATGLGIIEENRELLNGAYNTMIFEKTLVSTGGNKKEFINSKNRLEKNAMQELKNAWIRMNSNDSENNMIVLNEGLTFQEASQSSVEMQLNENKKTATNSIYSVFGVPENDYDLFIKQAVMPILVAIECALNRDFLLEKEKDSLYFSFDTKEITKGDMKTRFDAYKTALSCNLMTIDECRYREDLEPRGFNYYTLSLKDVLYDPETETVYTPNTGQITNMSEILGGDENANRIKK